MSIYNHKNVWIIRSIRCTCFFHFTFIYLYELHVTCEITICIQVSTYSVLYFIIFIWGFELSSYKIFISFCNLFAILSETTVFYEFWIFWYCFYNVLVISNFELHYINFIGFLSYIWSISYTWLCIA
jgi:hypothetical protein